MSRPVTPEVAEEANEFHTPEAPDTVKGVKTPATPECPDTVVKGAATGTPQTLVKKAVYNLAKTANTPLTVVKPRTEATAKVADSPVTPTAMVKAGSRENLVDAQKTPAARFAAALQLATSPVSPTGTNKSKNKNKNKNVVVPAAQRLKIAATTAADGSPGVQQMVSRFQNKVNVEEAVVTPVTKPAAAADKPRSVRQSNLAKGKVQSIKSKMNMVEAAKLVEAPVRMTRKRKSEAVQEAQEELRDDDSGEAVMQVPARGPAEERAHYLGMRKDVASVARQFKRRKPTRNRKTARQIEPEAEEENTPMEEDDVPPPPPPGDSLMKKQSSRVIMTGAAATTIPLVEPAESAVAIAKKKLGVNALNRAQKLREASSQKAAERERKLAEMREAHASKKVKTTMVVPRKLPAAPTTAHAKAIGGSIKSGASNSFKKRAELEKARQIKLEEDIKKKDEMQRGRLEKDRQRKAKEATEKNARNDAKRAEAEKKREDAEKRRRKEDDAKIRREQLRVEEKVLQAQMLDRKRELEETKREFDKKLAKAKEQRKRDQEKRDQERQAKAMAADEARALKRREREAEIALVRAEKEKEQAMLQERQAEQAKIRESEMARLKQAAAASPASPYDSYNLDGLRSDASSDDEDDPREEIPKWAQGAALKNALYNQFIFTPPEKKVMAIFPSPGPPVLSEIFPKKKTKFRPRTSSAFWEPSPGRTNIHKRY